MQRMKYVITYSMIGMCIQVAVAMILCLHNYSYVVALPPTYVSVSDDDLQDLGAETRSGVIVTSRSNRVCELRECFENTGPPLASMATPAFTSTSRDGTLVRRQVTSGFPLNSCIGWSTFGPNGLKHDYCLWTDRGQSRCVVFQPLVWPSLVNACLYGLMVYVSVAGFVRFRKNRRCREGACTACGYPLRGVTARCPECGQRCANAFRVTQ